MKDDKLHVPYLEPGEYIHYKGNHYEVVGVALHSEDLLLYVVYKPLYETTAKLWIRPYDMFVGDVELEGELVPRFKKI